MNWNNYDMPISTPEKIREDQDRRDRLRKEAEDLKLLQARGYAISSPHWPGLAKITEEAGEVLQVVGKLQATFGNPIYYDGTDLRRELEKEIADLMAALSYTVDENNLDGDFIAARGEEKYNLYYEWKDSGQ